MTVGFATTSACNSLIPISFGIATTPASTTPGNDANISYINKNDAVTFSGVVTSSGADVLEVECASLAGVTLNSSHSARK